MKLNNANYFSPESAKSFFSASQIKQFLKCEASTVAELNGEWKFEPNQSMLVGGYVDAYFSGEMDEWMAAHESEVLTSRSTKRAEFKQADEIIYKFESDELAMRMLNGDRQTVLTGELFGYPFKAKLDCLLTAETVRETAKLFPEMSDLLFADGCIVDMKVMKDFNDIYVPGAGREPFWMAWKYDLQLAIYQELVRQKTGKKLPCYILACSREKDIDIGLFEIPQEQMDIQLEMLSDEIEHLADVKSGAEEPERCGCCSYCRRTKKLTGAVKYDPRLNGVIVEGSDKFDADGISEYEVSE